MKGLKKLIYLKIKIDYLFLNILFKMNVYFTDYTVSTITCNANIGNNIDIDLSILYEHITPNEENNNIIWIQNLRDNSQFTKGTYPKKIRKSKKKNKKKNRFDNQITIIFKIDTNYMPNIKIFKNGNIQLTGIKKTKDTDYIAYHIINKIKDIYNNIDNNIDKNNNDDFISSLEYSNFKIRMINTDFKTYTDDKLINKFIIRRKELHNILISNKYNNKSSFQPGIYQGVKLEYYYNKNNDGICICEFHSFNKKNINTDCKKVTVAIFESGSVLITGGITFEQVQKAYEYITSIIKDNAETIYKPQLNIIT
jgi:TATA-box binding protein (TBP) (component of TFIID and TFIIIB)